MQQPSAIVLCGAIEAIFGGSIKTHSFYLPVFLIFSGFCKSAQAEESTVEQKSSFYLNSNAAISYAGFSSQPSFTNAQIIQYQVGLVGAYRLHESWLLGLSTDYQYNTQLNDPVAAGGNYMGSRWNMLSPTLGWHGCDYTALADFQFLGNYNIVQTNANSGGKDAFTGPVGLRLRGTYNIREKLALGFQLSYLHFNAQNDTTLGNLNVSNQIYVWSLGTMFSYAF